jgi:hypothetical protein
MSAGTHMDPSSEIGKSFTQFAQELIGGRPAPPEVKKKFFERFNVPHPPALVSVE